jgi:DNA modification methylase
MSCKHLGLSPMKPCNAWSLHRLIDWGLRDYGVDGQIGLELTFGEYLEKIVRVFREARRVLRKDGTLWLNMGDCYNGSGARTANIRGNGTLSYRGDHYGVRFAGLKRKDLCMMPARTAMALQADGWWLRSDNIWSKPNPMPESTTDRPTRAHEYVFLLTRRARYFYDAAAIRTVYSEETKALSHETMNFGRRDGYKMPDGWATRKGGHGSFHRDGREKGQKQRGHGRRHAGFNGRWDALSKEQQQAGGANARTVWSIATEPYPEAHFATFPTELARRCILAGSRPGDLVLDPFSGSGTVALVADMLGRRSVGLELNPEYITLAERRITAPRTAEGLEKAAMEDRGQVRISW